MTLIVRWISSIVLVVFGVFDGRGETESRRAVNSLNAEFTSLGVGMGGGSDGREKEGCEMMDV